MSSRLISGGRLAERNQSDTLESSGVRWGSRVDSLILYWTNRPGGDSARAAAGSVCSADQADQVSSGSPTLPLLACTATDVPAGKSARHESAPKRLRNLVSYTSEVSSPWLTNPVESRTTVPGSPVPKRISPSGFAKRERICPLSSLARGVLSPKR